MNTANEIAFLRQHGVAESTDKPRATTSVLHVVWLEAYRDEDEDRFDPELQRDVFADLLAEASEVGVALTFQEGRLLLECGYDANGSVRATRLALALNRHQPFGAKTVTIDTVSVKHGADSRCMNA